MTIFSSNSNRRTVNRGLLFFISLIIFSSDHCYSQVHEKQPPSNQEQAVPERYKNWILKFEKFPTLEERKNAGQAPMLLKQWVATYFNEYYQFHRQKTLSMYNQKNMRLLLENMNKKQGNNTAYKAILESEDRLNKFVNSIRKQKENEIPSDPPSGMIASLEEIPSSELVKIFKSDIELQIYFFNYIEDWKTKEDQKKFESLEEKKRNLEHREKSNSSSTSNKIGMTGSTQDIAVREWTIWDRVKNIFLKQFEQYPIIISSLIFVLCLLISRLLGKLTTKKVDGQ